MKKHAGQILAGIFILAAATVSAEVKVTFDYHDNGEASSSFSFKTVPPPSTNDAATSATFTMVNGEVDPNSGGVEKLNDGKLPEEPDVPEENFFFNAGTPGGRIRVDLKASIDIRQVNTYSWHPNTRGPQVYKLYAADGTATNFNAAPKSSSSPEACGWVLLANVNTKPKSGDGGGQYSVSIANTDGTLGKYRYVLFDIASTENDDAFGNTFYSEIDVVDAREPLPAVHQAETTNDFIIKAVDSKCTIAINMEKAPQLKDWAEIKLGPILAEWYPKISAMLSSDGYVPPDRFKLTLKPMDGVAFTSGQNVVANSEWLKSNLNGEALGSLVHEVVHIVQHFGYEAKNPRWLVEGSADYIRWLKFEADKHGADMVWFSNRGKNFSPKYDDSYRVTTNFLNWVSEKYDKDIVYKLNAAMREHRYDEDLWRQFTGSTLEDLGAAWKREVETQIIAPGEKRLQN